MKMAQPTPELRQKEIAFGKKWMDIADEVGAGSVRVFGGGIAPGATEAQAVEWAVEVYKPILDYAATKGIVLGVEDDDDLTRTAEQLLTIVKKADHPFARIALDSGNFRRDGYRECERCAPYAASTHVKPHHGVTGRAERARGLGQAVRHSRQRRISWLRLARGIHQRTTRCQVCSRAHPLRADVFGRIARIIDYRKRALCYGPR